MANNYCNGPGCCWGTWKDNGCEGTNRVYSSIIWNASDWTNGCTTTSVGNVCNGDQRGALPSGPQFDSMKPLAADCQNKVTNMWGLVRVPDVRCGYVSPVIPPVPCFITNSGEFGSYRSDLVNKGWIPSGTQFSLIAENWIPVSGSGFTFLASDPGRMTTVQNIMPATYPAKLDNRFLYVADQTGCPTSSVGYLRYGDFFKLRSANTNQYVRCASGTCSLTDDSGDCSNGDWHTFIVTSYDNSKANGVPVCFGDEITIQQTVGSHANITAADGGNVWACDDGNCNRNYRLKIVPDSGSIYSDPKNQIDSYDKTRKNKSCAQNPTQAQCIQFGSTFQWLVIGAFVIGMIIAIAMLVRSFRSKN